MAISQSTLLSESQQVTASYLIKRSGQKTAFLCHSHSDEKLALGLQAYLRKNGWDLYIDWQDSEMPERPDRSTAQRIKSKIKIADWFLFLATANSMNSRWCPWELGYADGTKPIEQIAVVPTSDGLTTHGNEYVELYRRIDKGPRAAELFEVKAVVGKPLTQL